MSETVYLDHNATSPLRPSAIATVEAALRVVGNGSSVHSYGREARKMIEQARADVAALCGATADMVTFTSGGTETNNLILAHTDRKRVLVSAIEHPSVKEASDVAEAVPVTSDGIVDLTALDEMLAAGTAPALVSIMYANNETGIVQPVTRIAEITKKHGAIFHCDAVQAAGKVELDVQSFGADLLTLSAHKIGGPAGSGALINVTGVEIDPVTRGGGQENKQRSGTENFIGIAGFGGAAKETLEKGTDNIANAQRLRDRLESEICEKMPNMIVVGAGVERLPNTSFLVLPGMDSDTLVMGFDLAGVALSAGSACSSGTVKASGVLLTMGYGEEDARSVIRVSLGWSSKDSDVDAFLDALRPLYERAGHHQAA
jgi:cysteine desulfurase